LEECYEEQQAGLEECVDCAWIEVLSGTADIHCDDEILAVLETKAAECDRCLTECGEQQQQASLLSCAADLYCPMDEDEGIEVSQYHTANEKHRYGLRYELISVVVSKKVSHWHFRYEIRYELPSDLISEWFFATITVHIGVILEIHHLN
jgi:hypothetical protein